MAEEKRTDDVDKFLVEQKAFEERKQSLIEDLLKQREAAIAAFDERLAKIGYQTSSKSRKSHHKKPNSAPSSEGASKATGKPKT